jgi:zinc/manganese transport system substrate-binding protein
VYRADLKVGCYTIQAGLAPDKRQNLLRMILNKKLIGTLVCAALAACSYRPAATQAPRDERPIVVATTSTLGSLVAAVAGNAAQVHSLVPIGASPETYEPVPRDLIDISHAAVIVENGAGLEAWLGRLLGEAPPSARIVVLSDALPPGITHPNGDQFANPHFWLDPHYAVLYVRAIATALAAADPAHAELYRANAAAEERKLADLDTWIVKQIATIPPSRRVMIADHDAWFYFDRRYGIKDVGAIEKAPGKEPSAGDLVALINAAKANNAPAIFAEPEFSPRLAKQLAASAGIATVTDLYDDSLGTTPELATYDGMMRHDVQTIVEALK